MLARKYGGSLAVGAPLAGGTAGDVLYVGAGGVLAQGTLASLGAVIAAGVAGGQTVHGDTSAGGNLTLISTAHATKGSVYLGSTAAYIDASGNLFLGSGSLTAPSMTFASGPTYGVGYDAGNLLFFAGGVLAAVITDVYGTYRVPSGWSYTFSSSAANTAASDCGIGRAGTMVVTATNGSTGGGCIATGSSATAGRPAVTVSGARWYDTTLKKPIYWDAASSVWRDAMGTAV